MSKSQSSLTLTAVFTAVFISYFMVWLPGPAAGLRFIGFEIGEWIKFLGVGIARNWFYAPPITLGLMLAVWTMTWADSRFQNWIMRGLAVGVSLLSFPAIEAIQYEAASEWRLRLLLIGFVGVTAVLTGVFERLPLPGWLPWFLIAILGLTGAIGPTRQYLAVRPLVSGTLGLPVGIGWGVWLNGVGHLGATVVAVIFLRKKKEAEL
jgi:hypothetical protein